MIGEYGGFAKKSIYVAGHMPYLKEADDTHLSRDEMGQYLVYEY